MTLLRSRTLLGQRMLVRSGFMFATVLLLAATAQAVPYAQLSSSETQLGSTTPKMVTLNSDDALSGISNSKGVITFKEAGTYFVMAAAQVGSSGGNGKGNLRLWMRQNGTDVANSNTEQTVTPGFTAVLCCQGVAEIKAGDKLELMFSVSTGGEKLGLIASTPSGEPAVPSMIFSAFKADDMAYGQLSSTQTQTAAAGAARITLNSTDAAKGVENKDGVVTIKTPGTYFVMAAGQVGGTEPKGKGTVRLWVRQNGTDVANSNTEQTITPGFTAVLVCQGVMECKAGDKVELLQAASGSGVGMVASAPKGEPTVPSMILSVVKVGDGAYAQLSSVQTQTAGAKGQVVTLNQTDAAKNIENSNGTITIKKAGFYFVIAAGQVGGANGSSGAARLWLRQNGADVANSNTEQTIPSKYTAVLVCQGVGECKAGDKLQLMQSAKGSGIGMIDSKPAGEPEVPSMIFSLVKVD